MTRKKVRDWRPISLTAASTSKAGILKWILTWRNGQRKAWLLAETNSVKHQGQMVNVEDETYPGNRPWSSGSWLPVAGWRVGRVSRWRSARTAADSPSGRVPHSDAVDDAYSDSTWVDPSSPASHCCNQKRRNFCCQPVFLSDWRSRPSQVTIIFGVWLTLSLCSESPSFVVHKVNFYCFRCACDLDIFSSKYTHLVTSCRRHYPHSLFGWNKLQLVKEYLPYDGESHEVTIPKILIPVKHGSYSTGFVQNMSMWRSTTFYSRQ